MLPRTGDGLGAELRADDQLITGGRPRSQSRDCGSAMGVPGSRNAITKRTDRSPISAALAARDCRASD